ncbi:MAG: hypothetical protein AUH92_06725 [Acidobacteria bacterium 13_1_40CM_4_69_4]|nr:MAG: hypothetical protein AUH92_06725 [Acidobacteria bacterium 13_1_40CM_4_69_4]
MFSCQDLLDHLNDYLDDRAAAEVRRELEVHLGECRPCKVVLDSTSATIRIVSGCRSFDLPAELSAKIMAKIRAQGR